MSVSQQYSPPAAKSSVLPIILPASTLRPVAFRVLSKKHNLTVTSSGLNSLAAFIGKYCGCAWREEGLAELVLEEFARAWKLSATGSIVDDGSNLTLQAILNSLSSNMKGGKVIGDILVSKAGEQQTLEESEHLTNIEICSLPDRWRAKSSSLEEGKTLETLGHWITITNAFEQHRLTYNTTRKQFVYNTDASALFPDPSGRIQAFRDRYNVVQQRLLRNESFGDLISTSHTSSRSGGITPIASLLGRNGTSHFLLGMLSVSPGNDLCLADLTGSISLNVELAEVVPKNSTWFVSGMMAIVDGVYREESSADSGIPIKEEVDGRIGGQFIVESICGPPSERRENTIGTHALQNKEITTHGGFDWVDFIGVGNQRIQGSLMREMEKKYLLQAKALGESSNNSRKTIILSEIHLNNSQTINALNCIFRRYAGDLSQGPPPIFIMIGNFTENPVNSERGSAGSSAYKQCFDTLAFVLVQYPRLHGSKFLFVPGDNDPWAATGNALPAVPRGPIPAVFTSRVKRIFQNKPKGLKLAGSDGDDIWTSNPARVSFFGPVHELVLFRDNMSGRFHRNAIGFREDQDKRSSLFMPPRQHYSSANPEKFRQGISEYATVSPSASPRKLVKTVLDQGYLSPFPLAVRPVVWNYAHSLSLYPLPSALVLADPEMDPFLITYEGCHVINPGCLVPAGSKGLARWVEYDIFKKRGSIIESHF